ncbi:echinoidin-like [Haliotis rufescens]|uniref:echinoidin-like n=1 Tax=Haliotis rufescens TaxID=6454 RepID=UPI00201E85B0|nr:echinoidin-like [Haliotis rufescens]
MLLACAHCSCPNYWTSFEGSCYTLIQNPSTWAEAEEICKDFDGFLVEISSSGENNFIKSFVKNKGLSVRAVWLGGNDLLSEANWMWSHSKLNLDFTNWAPGQPDNAKHAENCFELVHAATATQTAGRFPGLRRMSDHNVRNISTGLESDPED